MSEEISRKEIPLPTNESSLKVIDVTYANGKVRRLWAKDDGVQVMGVTPDGKIIAITERGYTHLIGGYIEPEESPEAAAGRELLEETGYTAGSIQLLAAPYQDSGGSERVIWFYLAANCHKVQDSEKGIDVTLMYPREFWEHITSYLRNESGEKRRGLMSLALATLVFQKLEWLNITVE